MNMEIKHKLYMLVTVVLLLMLTLGGFSWYLGMKSFERLSVAEERLDKAMEAVNAGDSALIHFKTQIQEWKNILLRGKDKDAYAKHLKAFQAEGRQVVEQLEKLNKIAHAMGLAEQLKIVEVIRTFGQLEPAYLEALKQFNPEAADPAQVVDKAVKGMDRAPSQALSDIIKKLDEYTDKVSAQEKQGARERYDATRTALIVFLVIVLVVIKTVSWYVLKSINDPLDNLEQTMRSIAATNDLTLRVEIRNQDEIGRMSIAFNDMVDRLHGLVRKVGLATAKVNASAAQLAQTAEDLRLSSNRQSGSVSANASSIEQLTVSIATVADTAETVRADSNDSVSKTSEGNQKVSSLVSEIRAIQGNVNQIAESVEEFVKSTSAITNMTQEVREIADQTNLLALNAAIEAARAGEQGRGFAVVADEVRKLAEKSGSSAGEIDGVAKTIMAQSDQVRVAISEGLKSIEASASLASEVEDTLNHARQSVEHAGKGVNEIAHSVAEQKVASTEIAQNMERISHAAEESSAAAQGMSAASAVLKESADGLSQAIAGFKT